MVLNNAVTCPTIYHDNKIDVHEQVMLLRYLGMYFDEIIIFGTIGDQTTIDVDEKIKFIEHLETQVNLGFKKVYAVSGNNTESVLKLVTYISKYTECSQIMLMPVPSVKLSQKELFDYVEQVKRTYFGKIILYNNDIRTVNKYEVETINHLYSSGIIAAVKDLSNVDPRLIKAPVYSGLDLDFLSNNYQGVVSVLGSILPNTVNELAHKEGKFKHKNELIEVINCLNNIGIAKSVKYILSLKGITSSFETISPMQKVTLSEMLVLYELYSKRISILENIYDQNIQLKIK